MPSTVLGLVLFVISLAPGLAFVLFRERVAPQRALSPFRESALVLCVSIVAVVGVLAAFAVLRATAPAITPDVGLIINDPGAYFRTSYVSLFWWAVVLLTIATAGAGLIGSGAMRRLAARIPGLPIVADPGPHVSGVSSWWLAFRHQARGLPDTDVYLECLLTDGSYVAGYLLSFSNAAEDSKERDLTLAPVGDAPIIFRAAGVQEPVRRSDVGAVVLAATQIQLIFVSYVTSEGVSDPDE